MTKSTKRSKKKTTQKVTIEKSPVTKKEKTIENEEIKEWTHLQLEQMELAEKLNNYINSFQKKLLDLNFIPSDRELVLLFIMNLHSRWRRFVEPIELSISTWVEAAAYARLHCARVSAILGCEKNGPDSIFKTPETRTLRDTGYFSPDFVGSPDLQNLLKKHSVDKELNGLLDKEEPSKVEYHQNDSKSTVNTTISDDNITCYDNMKSALDDQGMVSDDNNTVDGDNAVINENNNHIIDMIADDKEVINGSEEIVTNKAVESIDINKTYSNDKPSMIPNISNDIRVDIDDNTVDDIKEGLHYKSIAKKKKKEKQYKSYVATKEHVPTSIDKIPPEHEAINLTFLDLSINDKKIRALLSKTRWKESAITIGCVKRLGLEMNIESDFDDPETIGMVQLPIQRNSMTVRVVSKIYEGRVDLLLGEDFFINFDVLLNINMRSIYMLGNEVPYIVDKLDQ